VGTHTETCTLVWRLVVGLTKTALKKTPMLIVLETLVVEVETVLNDRPLMHTIPEIDDMGQQLYSRRITSLLMNLLKWMSPPLVMSQV